MIRKFSVTYVMEVDEDNNFLSAHEEGHTEDVHDLVSNVMHDIDDVRTVSYTHLRAHET